MLLSYKLVLSTNIANHGRICITTEPNSTAVFIRIDNTTGVFCTDRVFSSAQPDPVCARNVSGSHSTLQFSTGGETGETNAVFMVDGQTRTQFAISYGVWLIKLVCMTTAYSGNSLIRHMWDDKI